MMTIYDNCSSRFKPLLQRYNIDPYSNDFDGFLLAVKNQFFIGVHAAYQEFILQALIEEYRTRQNIADALGLKTGTSISHISKSGTIDGVRLTAAMFLLQDGIMLPTQVYAALSGFARAASFIKTSANGDKPKIWVIPPQDFSYLVSLLTSKSWDSAYHNAHLAPLRELAWQIINEENIPTLRPVSSEGLRPEQCVLKLVELKQSWEDFAIITLCAIPECIPVDERRAKR